MTLTILPPEIRGHATGTVVLFHGHSPEGPFTVRVTHSKPLPEALPPTFLGDAAVAFFLLPALRLQVPLEIHSPISARLLATLPTQQEIYCSWYRETFPRAVDVRSISSPLQESSRPSQASGRGCFFSGGVDSFHAVLKHRETLDHLIFVHGFDVPLDNALLRAEVSSHLQAAAHTLDLSLVEVETDIRTFSDRFVHWGSHYCGAAMGAVAHLLSPWLGRVIIPASMSYLDLQPFGTHIYTDERWSSEALTLRHEGMEAKRLEKIRAIASHPTVQQHLRVCWRNHDNRYNCGRCEKCLRTMANLRALGHLGACQTFPSDLDLQALAMIDVDHPVIVPFLQETLAEARKAGDVPLAQSVSACLANSQATLLARELTPLRDLLPQDEIWITKAAPRFRDAILASCWETDPEWTRQELARHLTADPDTAFDLLWRHQRGWLLRRWLAHRLAKLNPLRLFRRAAKSGKKQTTDF